MNEPKAPFYSELNKARDEITVRLEKTEWKLSASELSSAALELLLLRGQMAPPIPPHYDVHSMTLDLLANDLSIHPKAGGLSPIDAGCGIVLRTAAGFAGAYLTPEQCRELVRQLTSSNARSSATLQ